MCKIYEHEAKIALGDTPVFADQRSKEACGEPPRAEQKPTSCFIVSPHTTRPPSNHLNAESCGNARLWPSTWHRKWQSAHVHACKCTYAVKRTAWQLLLRAKRKRRSSTEIKVNVDRACRGHDHHRILLVQEDAYRITSLQYVRRVACIMCEAASRANQHSSARGILYDSLAQRVRCMVRHELFPVAWLSRGPKHAVLVLETSCLRICPAPQPFCSIIICTGSATLFERGTITGTA